MNQQQLAKTRIEPLPSTIESPRAKLVYLYLDAADGGTIDDLNRTLSMRKIAILSVLGSLSENGLVERIDGEYVTRS